MEHASWSVFSSNIRRSTWRHGEPALISALGGRGRLQGKQWSRHHCQYDVTSYISDFQNGAQSCTRRAVKKCRIFFGKTDLFAVVGNAEVSTIIYELYLLFFCEPKTFDSFIVRKKHFNQRENSSSKSVSRLTFEDQEDSEALLF